MKQMCVVANMLLKLILVLITIWLVYIRWARRRKIQCFKQYKNDIASLPVVGHAYMMIGNGEVKMKAIQILGHEAMKQGGVTTMQSWILDQFYAMVADAGIAEIILRNCLEKDDTMKLFHSIFGSGLLVSPVPEWRLRRKILNPAFTMKSLNQYVDIFQKNSAFLVEKLKTVAKTGPFSIYDHVTAYSLDSVFESIYGFEISAQKDSQHPVMKALSVCCELVSNRICLPWLHNQTVYEMTSQFTTLKKNADLLFNFIDEKIIMKCKEFRSSADFEDNALITPKKPKTILQIMVESSSKNNETLSDVYLREDTFVVTFAGTDTTSVALSFIFVMLSRFPNVQERMYQEVMQVLSDTKKPINAADLPHLKYTEAVIKETLRMYPPAPLVLRKIDKDVNLPSGKNLVAGTGVIINVWAIHHNPLYWEHPEQFRPERFLDSAPQHPAAFLPFSYGVRNCIGAQFAMMSLKTSLASLIRQYQILPVNDNPKALQEPLRLRFDVMLRDVDNYTVQLVSRI